MMQHTSVKSILVFGMLALAGCRPAVFNTESAEKEEPVVRASQRVASLTVQEVNDYFKKKQQESSQIAYGTVFEVTGKVKEVLVNPKKNPEDFSSMRVALWLPDYAAASIECYFAPRHEVELKKLKPGDQVTIRGKLVQGSHQVREHVIDLNGCILISR